MDQYISHYIVRITGFIPFISQVPFLVMVANSIRDDGLRPPVEEGEKRGKLENCDNRVAENLSRFCNLDPQDFCQLQAQVIITHPFRGD